MTVHQSPSSSFQSFLQKLIRCCGEIKAAPTENEEVQFLCQVCSKLKQDSYLVNFFLEVSMQCFCVKLLFHVFKAGMVDYLDHSTLVKRVLGSKLPLNLTGKV